MSNETDTPGVTDINSRSANVMTTRKDTGGAPPVATLNGTLQRMAEERAAKEAARATVDRSNVITGSGINIPGAVLERSQKKRQKETSMHTNTSEEIVKPAPTATTGTGTATSTAIATKTRGLKRSAEEKAAKDAARLGTLNSAAATVGASAVLPSPPATTAHQRGLKQRSEKENDAKQAAIGTAISATSPAIAMVNPSKGTKGNMDVASLQPGAQFVTVTPASDSIRSTAAERLSTTTMRGLAKNRKSNVSSVQTAAMVAAENNTPGSFKTETVASVGLDGEGVGTTIISSEDSTTKAPPTGSGTAAKIVTNQTGRPQVDTDADLENQNQRMKESLQDITNVGLVEARAVAEASASQYFQEAQQVDDAELEQQADKAERERQKKEKERQCRRIGYAVMLVSLAIIAISLGVGLRPQKPGNTQTMGPQEKAREWLQNHPNYDQLSDWKKNQLLALATFFYAMQGEHWPDTIESDFGIVRRDRWLDYTKDECLWYSRQSGPPVLAKEDHDSTLNSGLTDLPSPCNELGKYTSLSLAGLEMGLGLAGMNPFLPSEIALLSSLSRIDLGDNSIQVPLAKLISPELYEMTGLRSLLLPGNLFSGQLPTEIALWTSLTHLDLSWNSLTGSIPSEIGMMTALEEDLFLWGNLLTGQIATEIGLLTGLAAFRIFSNELTGRIPSELGQMTSLTHLALDNNHLSGQIPSELGQLTALDWIFALNRNNLVGRIPSELGRLSDVERWFLLHHNLLTGQIPSELGLLTCLSGLYLGASLLHGQIPSEFGFLTGLQDLWLAEMQLSGQIPSELAMNSIMLSLSLDRNALSGRIPSEFGGMESLTSLSLRDNLLSGSIPTELGDATKLQELDLSNLPKLTGAVPSELSGLSGLSHLDLAGSRGVTGTMPTALCDLDDLFFSCTDFLCGCYCQCPPS